MKKLTPKTTGFSGTSVFFRPDGTFKVSTETSLPEGAAFGVPSESGVVISSLGSFIIRVGESVVVSQPVLWTLDWFSSPMSIKAFNAEEGGEFLDALFTINKVADSGSIRVYDFVDMEDGSMLSFDFEEVSQFGVLQDINVIVSSPDNTSTTYDTGEDWRPTKAFGGYRRGDNTFIFIEHKEGNDPVQKRIIKLDSSFTAVDSYSFADSSYLSGLVKTTTGGVFLSNSGELNILNESDMTVSSTFDLEAYTNSEGYDGGSYVSSLLSDKDDLVYIAYIVYDSVSGDERALFMEYSVSLGNITRYIEFDAPAFGEELGGVSTAINDGKAIIVGNRNDGPKFSTFSIDLDTFTLDAAIPDTPHDPDSGFYAWGTGFSNGDSKVFFGLDGGSAGVPFSLALVYDADTRTLSFDEFTPYASNDTLLGPVLVTFSENVYVPPAATSITVLSSLPVDGGDVNYQNDFGAGGSMNTDIVITFSENIIETDLSLVSLVENPAGTEVTLNVGTSLVVSGDTLTISGATIDGTTTEFVLTIPTGAVESSTGGRVLDSPFSATYVAVGVSAF